MRIIRRLDPFQTYLNNENILVGIETYFSSNRDKRPREFTQSKNQYSPKSPPPSSSEMAVESVLYKVFIGEEKGVFVSDDQEFFGNPFKNKAPTIISHKNRKALTFLNKYSVFDPLSNNENKGVMLVSVQFQPVIYPREASGNLKWLLLSMKNAIIGILEDSKDKFDVLNFLNVGPKSGSSVKFLHSQTYIFQQKPRTRGHFRNAFYQAFNQNPKCVACTIVDQRKIETIYGESVNYETLILNETSNFISYFAYCPLRLGQIRIIPKHHLKNVTEISNEMFLELGLLIEESDLTIHNFGMKLGFRLKDRSIVFRESYSENQDFHLLVDVLPFWPLGSVELLDSINSYSITPEHIKLFLREHKLSMKRND